MFEVKMAYVLGVITGMFAWYLADKWRINALAKHGDECGKIILKQEARIEELKVTLTCFVHIDKYTSLVDDYASRGIEIEELKQKLDIKC